MQEYEILLLSYLCDSYSGAIPTQFDNFPYNLSIYLY